MFKNGKKTTFKDKNKLNKLINLRIFGFSEVSLALLTEFNVDRTALIYHFKKYGIGRPQDTYDIPRMVSKMIPPSFKDVWVEIDGERVNTGRTYKEYLSHRNYLKAK